MDIARKRIMADMKNLRKNTELQDCGIHVKFNDSNIYNAQAMILGPKDTPYEKGFYFFDINFPSDYPMNPPKVKFCTLLGNVRFNPNLYACGKVCLSILGTWSGPGWTSCLTLSTVLLSIQSLMNENPITNEPGFEKEPLTGDNSQSYNKVISYNNIRVAVVEMYLNCPYLFQDFKPIMNDYFMKYNEFYIKYVEHNMINHGKKFSTRMYSMNGKFNFKILKEKLLFIKEDLKKINEKNNKNENVSLECNGNIIANDNTTESITTKIEKKKKVPNENANDYELGKIIKSSNDDRNYVVKKMSFEKKLKSGETKKIEFNKWVLYK